MLNKIYPLVLLTCYSCALLQPNSPVKTEEIKEDSSMKMKQDLGEMNQKLLEDIKSMLRSELIPEIKGANHIPKKVLKNQKKAKASLKNKLIIGRVEWIRVDSDAFKMRAKVDTGARTCSIHAENIIEKEIDGKKYIQFESLDHEQKKHVFLKEVVKSQKVKSSNGSVTNRYVIKMNIKLGTKTHDVHVNLNDREDLRFNFLIGRNLLRGAYVVDVVQTRLLGE